LLEQGEVLLKNQIGRFCCS